MAQVTDRTVWANPSGFDMRTELNNIIGALETCNSGESEPLNTVAFMDWFDTSNATYYYLKKRNHNNTAWNTVLRYTVATKLVEFGANALTATQLATARNINGISFNGTANIEIEDRLGTAIASAATTTIGTVGLGNYIHITGTTTITSFGTAGRVGIRRTLIFDGALTVTHNATSLICLGAANIITVAGTIIEVVAETTANWRVLSISHPMIGMLEIGYLDGVTSAIQTQINAKQATLVSGTNIKTINSNSLLGSGNIVVGETEWTANDSRAKTALNATGTAPIYACRAWVNFNGTGTVAIRESGNVSSITDNGTGDYSINFTTAMPDVNYSASIDGRMNSGFPVNGMVSSTIPTASVVRIYTYRGDNNPGLADSDYVLVNIFR